MKYLILFSMFLSFNSFASLNLCTEAVGLLTSSEYVGALESLKNIICKNGKIKSKYKTKFKPLQSRCTFACDDIRREALSLLADQNESFRQNYPQLFGDNSELSEAGQQLKVEKARREEEEKQEKDKKAIEDLEEAETEAIDALKELEKENIDKIERFAEGVEEKLQCNLPSFRNSDQCKKMKSKQSVPIDFKQVEQAENKQKKAKEKLKKTKEKIEKRTQEAQQRLKELEKRREATEKADEITEGLKKLDTIVKEEIENEKNNYKVCKDISVQECARIEPKFRKYLEEEKDKLEDLSDAYKEYRDTLKNQDLIAALLKTNIAQAEGVTDAIDKALAKDLAYEAMDKTLLGQYIDEKAMAAACAAKQDGFSCDMVDGSGAISNIQSLKTAIEKQTQEVRKAKATKE